MYFNDDLYSRKGNGYCGWSMSNNAVQAYSENKKPISKWSKADLLETCEALAIENKIDVDMTELSKLNLYTLKQLLVYSEYHHTGKYFNRTDFYEVSADLLKELIASGYPNQQAPKKPKSQTVDVDTGLYAHGTYTETTWTGGKWKRPVQRTYTFINAKVYDIYKDDDFICQMVEIDGELIGGGCIDIIKTTKRKINGFLSSKQAEKLKNQIAEMVAGYYKRTGSTAKRPDTLEKKIAKLLKDIVMTGKEKSDLVQYSHGLMTQCAKGAN